MPKYAVDFSYKVTEWGLHTVDADSPDEAEDLTQKYFLETFEDAEFASFTVEGMKEIG